MKHQQSEKVPSTIKLVLGLSSLLAITVLFQSSSESSSVFNNNHKQTASSVIENPLTKHDSLRSASSSVIGIVSKNTNNVPPSTRTKDENTTATTTTAVITNTDASPAVASTTTTEAKPRLFTCGFDLWNLGHHLFGDLEHVGRFGETSTGGTEQQQPLPQDILLQGGLNGPCHKSPEQEFPGKVLFVHSEARTGGDAEKQEWNERFFKLGPTENAEPMMMGNANALSLSSSTTSRALPMVTFGAIYFVSTTTPEQRQWILDAASRPNSSLQNPATREAVVYLVNRCGTFRKQAAIEISDILPIHQNPKCSKPNSHHFEAIPKDEYWKPRNSYQENYKLYSKYKYCLVMENTSTNNYITEKLFMAFMGGCLPIYWGSQDTIFALFNKDAFVFYDKDAPEKALAELEYLQSNQTYYQEKMAQPILAHNGQQESVAEAYLSLAQDVGNGRLRSRIRKMLGII
mmetsp:Transcript_40316/g.97367  ORF Transcript_40316/g.97367 Transcript_40316/m.97367 type:complete len:460 (+) Transcript_40316:80-1459(+)